MPKKKKKISASNMAIERHMLNRDLKQLNTTMKSSLKEMTALLKKNSETA